MTSMLESLMGQLGGGTLSQVSRELGANEAQTGTAMAAALPMLLGALSRNASSPQGAESLLGALQRDHDGAVLDDLPRHVSHAQAGPGDGILRHVLGDRRQAVEARLSRSSGMDAASVGRLLTMLAPVVMGALGREQRRTGLDARGLSGMLSEQEIALQRQQPEASSLVGRLLDADGDGDFDMGDVAKRGIGILGKFLRR